MGMFDIKKVHRNGESIVPEAADNPPAPSPMPGPDSGLSREELKLREKQLDTAVKISEGAVRIGTGILEIIKLRAQNESDLKIIREQRISKLSVTLAEMEKDSQDQDHWNERFDKKNRLFRETLVFLAQSGMSPEENMAAMETLRVIFEK